VSTASDTTVVGADVRALEIGFPAEAIDDLRRRIAATRLPDKETVSDVSQGVQLAVMDAVMRYWGSEYDFGRVASRLGAFPNYVTEIDGVDIHFIHVRSRHEDALPMIVTHGWPGSVIEMLNTIGPLTDPTAHGGTAQEAFHLVIPSMPGYGLSGKPTVTGWDAGRIADAWIVLMERLGYSSYVAQGGDWGAIVTDLMGVKAPPELAAIHSNMPGVVPPEISSRFGFAHADPAPDGLSADEQRAYGELTDVFTLGVAYALQMGVRPQTLYGIADSPAGLAAWMLDHDAKSYEDISHAFLDDAPVGGLTRDEVLDNITFTWLTNTGISSARLYWENKLGFFDVKNVNVPAAVTVFPRELYETPRSWSERAYPKLMYFNEVDRGDHFAAWQEPQLFTEELRAAFRSPR
jgi:pimeloyl-ACP methyl ester carboxylesterase